MKSKQIFIGLPQVISNNLCCQWITHNETIRISGSNELRKTITTPLTITTIYGTFGCCQNDPVLFNYRWDNTNLQVSLKNTWQKTATTVNQFKFIILFI